MVSLRHRTKTRFAVLCPANSTSNGVFRNIEHNQPQYDNLVAEMQRLRGAVYLRDEAIQRSDLTSDGRHLSAIDERSWHVLSLDRNNRICACLRYSDESWARGFDDLWIRHAALSRVPELGWQFRGAVEDGMRSARDIGMGFGEVGGWAVAEQHRCTFEPLRIVLATYGLGRLLGGAVGLVTATFRHDSAPILRRIGLKSLVSRGKELPRYFDPAYGCDMEVLEFDSRRPSPKYEDAVNALAEILRTSPVICREIPKAARKRVRAGLEFSPELATAAGW